MARTSTMSPSPPPSTYCGKMPQAQQIFYGILLKNLFLWNFIIREYACNGCPFKSLVLYHEILSLGQKADNFTYPFVLESESHAQLHQIRLLLLRKSRFHCPLQHASDLTSIAAVSESRMNPPMDSFRIFSSIFLAII